MGAKRCPKSNGQASLRVATYNESFRLGTCSRDPVGFEGSEWNLYEYCSGRALNGFDPLGTYDQPTAQDSPPNDAFQIFVRGKSSRRGGCGDRSYRRWTFSIRGNLPCDEGFLVQKVTVNCRLIDCDECEGGCGKRLSSGAFSYYESWYVKDGKVEDVRGYTDMAQGVAPNKTCGGITQTGEVRFYCMSTTGDLGRKGIAGLWHPYQTHGNDFGCPVSAEALPSTGEKPIWWEEKPKDGNASAKREFSMDWNCCDKKKVDVSFDP